ncbi:unnamed protein product [Alopecurus aequalis]
MYESPPTPTTAPPGRSDDALEVFHDILLAGKPTYSFHSGAALAPDRLSLCVLRKDDWGEPPQALQLSLELDTKESPLPEIEGADPYVPISADGHIWAMSATEHTRTFTVVTRRLGRKRWEQVGDPFTSPLIHNRIPYWGGWFLQGYAVLPRHNLILVSFQQYGLFLTFATDSGCWTSVGIDTRRSEEYLPIKGRAIYMEEHNAVYMLSENTIYAYQLIYCNDAKLLRLDPPTESGDAWPMPVRPPARHRHHLHLRDGGGIDVLHSTYRRVHMVPSEHHQEFCFLQEYEDEAPLQHKEEQEDSSQHGNEPSKMLDCCRDREESLLLTPRCFECGGDGHLACQCTENYIITIPFLGRHA